MSSEHVFKTRSCLALQWHSDGLPGPRACVSRVSRKRGDGPWEFVQLARLVDHGDHWAKRPAHAANRPDGTM